MDKCLFIEKYFNKSGLKNNEIGIAPHKFVNSRCEET